MSYTVFADFGAGLDVRKTPETTQPGAVVELDNAFINAGGEVEKRKTFTLVAKLPPNTFGLGFKNNNAFVFGTTDAPPMPNYVKYEKLVPDDGGLMIKDVKDVTRFADKNYVVAEMSDRSIRHFFDAKEISKRKNQGTTAVPHKTKMYVGDERNLRFSAVNNPAIVENTGEHKGAGVIDITAQDIGSTNIIGIEPYYSYLSIFGQTSIQLWSMDPDPLQNVQNQVLGNIGLVARHGVARYGNGDVLFLSHTGIRSLRARDSSNAAVLNDIGSPIDSIIAAKRATMSPNEAEEIRAIVDPLTGHFWLVWQDEIFVLSLYPASSVTAWSRFLPNMVFSEIYLANSRVMCRRGDELLVYGTVPPSGNPWDVNAPIGNDPAEYDNSEVTVVTPFLDIGRPASTKHWNGIDVACTGTWEVYANPEPARPNAWTQVATVTDQSFTTAARLPLNFRSTHLALRFISKSNLRAKLSAFVLHHEDGEAS